MAYVEIEGSKLHYLEAGEGDPILFLHGIPTSSYLWRNVFPHLSSLGHCIAPDLIGFGQSDKPDINYSVSDHIHYINRFIELLKLKNITLVMHGFGSVIGFDYAMRNEKNCKGLVFYEAHLRSLDGLDVALPFQEQVLALQDEGRVADLIVNGAAFIDQMLREQMMQTLSEEEMNYYRQPFLKEGSAKPILQYFNELSFNNPNNQLEKLIANYSEKLTHSSLPKLMLYSVPGFITTMATIMWAKEHLPNLEIVDIGEELHFAQESYPQLIGEAISAWLQAVEQTSL